MDCENARRLIDAYIDGELSVEEIRALEDHAKACVECEQELDAAKLLKDTLEHMDDEITVPLEAQAAWRRAVRAEARKKNTRNLMRGVYAVAAALVLMFGVNLAFNDHAPDTVPVPAAGLSRASMNMIETDGLEDAAGMPDYSVRKKIACTEPAEAMERLQLLSAEYSANCFAEDETSCRVELSCDYLEDFLKSIEALGNVEESEAFEIQTDTVIVLVQLTAE